MKSILKNLGIAAVALAAGASVAAQAQTVAITNARLLMVGDPAAPRTVENGTLIIRNGRIAAVGASSALTVPDGVDVIDAKGGPVTPGLFAPLSAIGLEEISLDREGNDRATQGDVAMDASLDAADGFYTDSTVIPISRAGGVTRALSALNTGNSLFSGCAALVDLSGSDAPIHQRCAAHVVALGYAGARTMGDSRPAAIAQFRKVLDDVKSYAEDPFLYRRQPVEGRLSARDAEALVPVMRGERVLLVDVNGASDIRRVLDLAEEYGLKIALVGAVESHRLASEIAAANVPVILNPLNNLPGNFETFSATLKGAGVLARAGVNVSFYDDDNSYTHNLRLLPQLAGNAVANGMPYNDALAALTANPAAIYGVGDRFGTLTAGKVADVVIWDGDPLEVTSRPTHVFVNGQLTSLENRQLALARRYRDLSRGDLPHAYRGAQ